MVHRCKECPTFFSIDASIEDFPRSESGYMILALPYRTFGGERRFKKDPKPGKRWKPRNKTGKREC